MTLSVHTKKVDRSFPKGCSLPFLFSVPTKGLLPVSFNRSPSHLLAPLASVLQHSLNPTFLTSLTQQSLYQVLGQRLFRETRFLCESVYGDIDILFSHPLFLFSLYQSLRKRWEGSPILSLVPLDSFFLLLMLDPPVRETISDWGSVRGSVLYFVVGLTSSLSFRHCSWNSPSWMTQPPADFFNELPFLQPGTFPPPIKFFVTDDLAGRFYTSNTLCPYPLILEFPFFPNMGTEKVLRFSLLAPYFVLTSNMPFPRFLKIGHLILFYRVIS